jgi:hypothetical protein
MNDPILDSVKHVAKEMLTLDIETLVNFAYDKVPENYNSYYTKKECIDYINSFFLGFNYLLNSKLAKSLPVNFKNDGEELRIYQELDHLYKSLIQPDIIILEHTLSHLIAYQLQNGFYNLPNPSIDSILSLKEKVDEDIILLNETRNSITHQIDNLYKNLDNIKNLNDLYSSKSSEFNEIATQYLESKERLIGVKENLSQNEEELRFIMDKIHKNEIEIKEYRDEADKTGSQIELALRNFIEQKVTLEDLVKDTLNKSATFDKKLEQLKEIIGLEAAKSLFNTFNNRKEELKKPVRNWSYAVITSCILSAFYILLIFTNFFGYVGGGFPKEISWDILIINSIKTLPALILMYFTMKQYTKERKIREEYAFRSAIALTLQAYGDLAGSKKEEIIEKGVTNIFNLPLSMKDTINPFLFRSKDIVSLLKEINETLKNLKN